MGDILLASGLERQFLLKPNCQLTFGASVWFSTFLALLTFVTHCAAKLLEGRVGFSAGLHSKAGTLFRSLSKSPLILFWGCRLNPHLNITQST